MIWNHPYLLARRARAAGWIVTILFGTLAVAFFRVQVLSSSRYQFQSKENRLRAVPLPAPRGLITDRNGVVLAENIPGYSIALLAASAESLEAALGRLDPLVMLDSAAQAAVLRRYRRAPTEPVVVQRDAAFEVVSALEERRAWLPGLVIQSEPKRRYPLGELAAHVVGYVGEVTEEELSARTFPGARLGALVGRAGIERQYDGRLRGQDGVTFVEVDALGRAVREAREESMLEPAPGETMRLALDVELQRFIVEVFPPDGRGAVVAMDPRTGEVLALHSAPGYDPNAFIGGIDPELWREIEAAEDHPLFNRAIQGRYPPASPWKLVVATMALKRGLITIGSRMPIPCTGGMRYYSRYFRCWKLQGHGALTLAEAIQHSCDVYFYQLGIKLGVPALLHDGVELGFRARSGIDLPNEYRPLYPPSTEYYNRLYGPRGWTSAVALNLAIGQGENAQTLINMVRFYAMLANPNGMAPEPRVVWGAPAGFRDLGLSSPDIAALRESLVEVVNRGTAAGARIADLRIAGKTGTAQNPHGEDHGWFIAFAPADDPQIVVGAVVEFAKHGSALAPWVNRVVARQLVGQDVAPHAVIEAELVMPWDSAPEPVPILPDTAMLRIAPGDSIRGTPQLR